MGNSDSSSSYSGKAPIAPEATTASGNLIVRSLFQSFEHKSGKLLVKAIRNDSRVEVDQAVEVARKEFVKPRTGGVASPNDFDAMNKGLITYLTQDTDVGDGLIFTQKPIDFCRQLKAKQAMQAIEDHLTRYRTLQRKDDVKVSATVGEVSESTGTGYSCSASANSRAAIAKDRLKAFQAQRKQQQSEE